LLCFILLIHICLICSLEFFVIFIVYFLFLYLLSLCGVICFFDFIFGIFSPLA